VSEIKLTAKLSDGTEWEFTTPPQETFDKSGWVAWLKPLKPSPPKEVFLRVYSDNSISATYRTAKEAVECAPGYLGPSNIHRYTLATEETAREKNIRLGKEMFNADNAMLKELKKPAREWWDVRNKKDGSICSTFHTEDAASFYVRKHFLGEAYEVVHVREVVADIFNKENV